jgi:hypothetical protein
MGGGLMQLVAYGAQDIYLTGNPQITFFKVVYRRHTNFSMETILQTLNGLGSTTINGSTATATISRNGDLVHKVYVSFPTSGLTINGSDLVKEAELEIGGQRIDRHYQEWNEVWNELSTPESKAIGLKAMQFSIGSSGTGVGEAHIPLNFWFCRNPGLALPLIALQYHEVKIKLTFGAAGVRPNVWCDYIYLDTDERRRFAQVSHEYLIEQLQKEDKTSGAQENTHKLNFNHPVKELIWTTPAGNNMSKIKLQLNGHDRFSEQPEEYFTLRQPFDYHTAVPKQNLPTAAQIDSMDRSTQFLTLAAVGGVLGTARGAASSHTSFVSKQTAAGSNPVNSNGDIFLGTGTNQIVLQAGNLVEASFPIGTMLAITPIIVTGTEVSDTAGSAAVPGEIYFCVVTAVSISGSVLTITVTPPTTSAGTTKVLDFITDGDDSGSSTVTVHEVVNGNSAQARTSQLTKKIGVYSFALKPEEHQPSGTCNFSRIDNAQLIETSSVASSALTVYAVNYNVLRIMSGMGGLAYSN